jgi:hypothetical protein
MFENVPDDTPTIVREWSHCKTLFRAVLYNSTAYPEDQTLTVECLLTHSTDAMRQPHWREVCRARVGRGSTYMQVTRGSESASMDALMALLFEGA